MRIEKNILIAECTAYDFKGELDPVPVYSLNPVQTPEGRIILVLQVSAGAQTPYYLNLDGKRIAYVRRGNPGHILHPARLNPFICPWEALEAGELLTGPVAGPVRYAPGGLLNTIMGVGEAEAPPTPTEVEETAPQSLFG